MITGVSWSDWARDVEIEPSVYAADFYRLGEQIEPLFEAGARIFHIDIGDGHFIPPVTIGSVVVEALAAALGDRGCRLDCHLMVTNPDEQIPIVAAAGADSITFHIEATTDPERTIELAREQGVEVGVTLNPSTPVSSLEPLARLVDLVLLMSVVPGYSGQSFPRRFDRPPPGASRTCESRVPGADRRWNWHRQRARGQGGGRRSDRGRQLGLRGAEPGRGLP